MKYTYLQLYESYNGSVAELCGANMQHFNHIHSPRFVIGCEKQISMQFVSQNWLFHAFVFSRISSQRKLVACFHEKISGMHSINPFLACYERPLLQLLPI